MSERSAERGPRPWTTHAAGLGVSIALHAALYAVAVTGTSLSTVDFEIELPATAELGLSEATRAALPPAASPPEVPAPDAPAPPDEPAGAVLAEKPKPKPRPKPKRADAGAPDAGVAPDAAARAASAADAGTPTDAAVRVAARDAGTSRALDGAVASTAPSAADAGSAQLSAYAPAGTQLSLRLHMAALRSSSLAPEVQRLLAAIPDWQALLEGSGVDPLQDLERLFLASPNLSRASLVLAGEHRADDELPRRAVSRLAEARGVEVRWQKRLGFPVARWANRDATDRIVALLGDNLFAITRPDDLERMLAVAQGLAERSARERARDASVPAGEALLALPQGEAVHFGVEGARQFVRGQHLAIPQRLEGGVAFDAEGGIRANARAQFDEPAHAEQARVYWQQVVERLARHPLVALLGLASALRTIRLETDEAALRVDGRLNVQQARLVIGYLEASTRPAGAVPEPPPARPSP